MVGRRCYDIVILGAGFAGSLLAWIAQSAGRRVLLIEKGRHPRFAMGESSTPLADLMLARLAGRYGLSQIKPLCKYGSWKQAYPQVGCGLKRGFSFFRHEWGQSFAQAPEHANELLVAANPDFHHGDTHWYRADFDALLVDFAQRAGVDYWDECDVADVVHEDSWRIETVRQEKRRTVKAGFLADATGSGVLAEAVGARDCAHMMRTHSVGLYGHFRDVAPWADVLVSEGGAVSDHPFPCDAAALHHVLDGGWMWVLRFDNGITSAGFSLNPHAHPVNDGRPAEIHWARLLGAYPSIARQFRDAKVDRPLFMSGRVQRRWSPTAGPDWAMLPHAAGFVDPWLSSGIAQTLYGVERLARIIVDGWSDRRRDVLLAEYDRALSRSFDWLDLLIGSCLCALDRFEVLTSLTMIYFVAAIHSEERIRAGLAEASDEFLLAHDERFREIAATLCEVGARSKAEEAARFAKRTADMLAPYNVAGLCDPVRHNMYPFTGTI